MADIDLLSIKPHQVSRNLKGYSVFFYGDPKSGKTTIATKFPKHLLLAFEKGYNAIPGAMAQPINSWADFRKVLRQLKSPEAHEAFETIIIDTADIAYGYCEKYICANASVDAIGDIGYGKGYGMVEKEFDDCLRSIVQMDYGLVIISHAVEKTIKKEDGTEFNQIGPTLDKRASKVVSRMTDIIGYSRPFTMEDGHTTVKLFLRGNQRYMAGSRFKYTPDCIDFNYKALVNAIGDAIDKQMEEEGSEYFTDTASNLYEVQTAEVNFDDLIDECNQLISQMINSVDEQKFTEYFQPRITEITDKYLGRGKKINQCTREQTEALSLIVDDLRELVK